MGLLAHLQNLQIEGNKLKQIRADIVKGGTHRILKHLREKFEGDELPNTTIPNNVPFHEARIFPDK